MNKTPETDDLARGNHVVPTEWAEQLERERNLAISQWEICIELSKKLERERDEARENLEEEMKFHHRTHTELVHAQCKILDMQMGRDEIQDKYDTLAVENMLEVNKLCKERDEWAAMCGRYKQERDDAMDIIRKAKAKFCEDGADGKIASEMFSILIGNI